MTRIHRIKKYILKSLIFFFTKCYYRLIHRPFFSAPFLPGRSKINYAGRVFDDTELIHLIDASLDFYLTASKYDSLFCRSFSQYLSSQSNTKNQVIIVNSGSSANLVALTSLTSPKLNTLAIKEGDEVITVAAGFPTTVTPIIQNKLIPVFIDIELDTYNIDVSRIEKSITKKTKAIFLAHTLGFPFNLDAILAIAEKYKLWVIEDNCDALGAEYQLNRTYHLINNKTVSGTLKTGTIGHIGTTSFFPAHHITMGEGGAVITDNDLLLKIATSLRDWGKDCYCVPGKDNTCHHRFDTQYGSLPKGYDHKYVFSHLGYNLKATDLQAAIGYTQLQKLPQFIQARISNWKRLERGLKPYTDTLCLSAWNSRHKPSPFGFTLRIRPDSQLSRYDIIDQLEKNNIQTRPLFGGNLLRQPAFTNTAIPIRIEESSLLYSNQLSDSDLSRLKNTDITLSHCFWIGVYPGLTDQKIDYMISTLIQSISP